MFLQETSEISLPFSHIHVQSHPPSLPPLHFSLPLPFSLSPPSPNMHAPGKGHVKQTVKGWPSASQNDSPHQKLKHFDDRFPSSRTTRNKLPFFKPPSIWCSVMAAQAKTIPKYKSAPRNQLIDNAKFLKMHTLH